MLGWLNRVFNWGVTNIGGTIIGWVHDLIRGMWSVLDTIFGNVNDAWHDVWKAADSVWRATTKFGIAAWHALYDLARIIIPGIVRWAGRELTRLDHYITNVFRWAIRELTVLRHWIDHLISALTRWVMVHIWDPLWRSLTEAWKWIYHDGMILWYYITHPLKLAGLLLDPMIVQLEKDAWRIGALLGQFFFGLIIHNLKRFTLVVEDIMMAIF